MEPDELGENSVEVLRETFLTVKKHRDALPTTTLRSIIKTIRRYGYGDLPQEMLATACALKRGVTAGLVLSIDEHLANMRFSKACRKLQDSEYVSFLLDQCMNGSPLVTVCEQEDLPPLTFLKHFLRYHGYTKNNIKSCLSLNTSITVFQAPEHYAEFVKAKEADRITLGQDAVLRASNEFEDMVEQLLASLGVEFLTEKGLHQIYKREKVVDKILQEGDAKPKIVRRPGKTETKNEGLTPDFLIRSSFVVDGVSINWIDCKNFFGGSWRLIDKKVVSGAKKYNRVFGSGAVVFRHGCSEEALNSISAHAMVIDYINLRES